MPSPLLFLSLEPWDDIWRRNQFICAELARRHPERQILFVTPPRDLTYAIRSRQPRLLRATPPWSPPGLANIRVCQPTKVLPSSWTLGRKVNAALLRRAVKRWLRVLAATERQIEKNPAPILWINDHSAGHLVDRLGESATIYDITDDWTAFEQSPELTRRISFQDEQLCQKADEVIVCSERLFELKRDLVREGHLHLIPNGVDVDHYAPVLNDDSTPLPDGCTRWPQPVFGYTGTVHPDRIDLSLVEKLAQGLREGCLVFVGPNYLTPQQRDRLIATGRVSLHGPVSYDELPQIMRAFAACIVPHRVTDFTESLNPIKLWEYLAAGIPIVSTPVAGFRDFPELVHLAADPEEFLRLMKAAATEDVTLPQRRRDEASKHSWSSRVDQVEAVLKL